MTIYFLGCVLALIALMFIYHNTPSDNRCDVPEAAVVYVVGTIGSWLTIMLIVTEYFFGSHK